MSSSFGDGDRGEAAAEELAEMQATHLPMKRWYLTADAPAEHTAVRTFKITTFPHPPTSTDPHARA